MKKSILAAMFIAVMFTAHSCTNIENPEMGHDKSGRTVEGTGLLNVRLVDAPLVLSNGLTVEEVNVVITRVDVVKKGSAEEHSGMIRQGQGVFTVLETTMEVNLLDYVKSSGISALIGSIELEAGTYIQLRLIVDITKSTIKFAGDDTRYFLNIPSGGTSGIKIMGSAMNPLFTIGDGEEADLFFDFDASQSVMVHETSKDLYTLRPVIKEVQFQNKVVGGLGHNYCN